MSISFKDQLAFLAISTFIAAFCFGLELAEILHELEQAI